MGSGDFIREAFSKVKEDISYLMQELNILKRNVDVLNKHIFNLTTEVYNLKQHRSAIPKLEQAKEENPLNTSAHPDFIPAHKPYNPAHFTFFKPLKDQNKDISIGNNGVPTDRQTNQQTDKYVEKPMKNPIQDAAEILESLDILKKEIRLKFKRITEQEMLVFSTLYRLDEEKGFADYKTIAERLKLTESSIRDYVSRLISKGIPVDKTKINNKTIHLKISENLKKVAPLSVILQLRDL